MENRPISGSDNYIWFLEESLGHGSMGHVYVGRHRHSGDKYAVKVFNKELKMMQKDYVKIELDILKHIPAHKNIVKILGVEVQRRTNEKVIIMEYCEGGSLQDILNKPENYFGLREEEFLLVFQHIGKALEHLHNHQIIHRDIKPGNILLCILSDNSYIYKLTDFGTSKCVQAENGEFQSITGTEEYLHPDMHRDLFISKISGGQYNSHVDLWSFGVTVYQCASGQFPFIPRQGVKSDKQTMQMLTRHKEPGVISQIEMPDGHTLPSQKLPDQCYLTSGTKEKAEEFLAMLFDLTAPISPKDFFEKLNHFTEMSKIYMFDAKNASIFTSYLDGHVKLCGVKKEITRWTGVPGDEQLLFWDMKLINDNSVMGTNYISQWLKTTEDRPLMMISCSDNSRQSGMRFRQQPFQRDLPKDTGNDVKCSKETFGIIYLMEAAVKQHVAFQQNVVYVISLLRIINDNKLKLIKEKRSYLEQMVDLLEIALKPLISSNSFAINPEFGSAQNDLQKLEVLEHINSDMNISVCQKSHCGHKAERIRKDCQSLYQIISDQPTGISSHNQNEIKKYNKSELRRKYRHMRNMLNKHCLKETMNLCEQLEEPIRCYLSLIAVGKGINSVSERIEEWRHSFMTFSQSKATTSGCSAGRNNETMKSLTMNNSCNGEMLVRTVSNSSRTEIRNYSPSLVEQDVHRGTGQIHSVEGVPHMLEELTTISQELNHLATINTDSILLFLSDKVT